MLVQLRGAPIPAYLIEPNRTPIVRLGSLIEYSRTHTKIWSIEQNRTFDCRTVDNRTKSNVRLPPEQSTVVLNQTCDYQTPKNFDFV